MPQRPQKRKKKRSSAKGKAPSVAVESLQTGMPALDSITGVQEIRHGKSVYRIIHTNEIDEYEQPVPKTKRKKPA